MRLVVSWLRDFVDVKASPEEIAETLGLRGFEVASVEPLDAGDAVIDFEVTANRPDCLSVLGLAREVATAYGVPLTPAQATAVAPVPAGESDRIHVTIEDAELCPRYAAAVADVAAGHVLTPPWMSARLQAAGVRPISPDRRRDELRAPRAGPADARIRPGQSRRPVHPRAAGGAG